MKVFTTNKLPSKNMIQKKDKLCRKQGWAVVENMYAYFKTLKDNSSGL